MRVLVLCILAIISSFAAAQPAIPANDLALRHDIQRLADAGVIKGPTTTWPLAWGPILNAITSADESSHAPDVFDALVRVRQRAQWETRTGELTYRASASIAEKPTRIRSFQGTPRETGELSAGLAYTADRFAISLNGQAVDSASDGEDFRADGSSIGVALGNFSISVNTLDRWWGPGWDGSLILSNNARPIPALSIDRNFTDPFKSKWLSWLGPWDLSVHFGQMESARDVPDAQFFGMRFNFRPVPSLEIGISRSAQWCGEGRPCDFETFGDLFLGKDNVGDAGIDPENEPGNQLAGLDFRWSPRFFNTPFAVYGQFIGEDEAGGFPSRYLAMGGIEFSGYAFDRWSYRAYGELAGTSCDFLKEDIFNCAYNHGIYTSGYRYRGRPVGHGVDNDALITSVGLVMVDTEEMQWRALLRFGDVNRGGLPDARNSISATETEIASLDLAHSRVFRFGQVDIGVGVERFDGVVTSESTSDVRAYLQWRSAY